jgi:plastocyanin
MRGSRDPVRTAVAAIAVGLACLLAACSETASPEGRDGAAGAASASPGSPGASIAGLAPAAVNGVRSIVVLEPRPERAFPLQADTPVMDQVAMIFVPSLLLVRTGQPAEFRNSDEELHNVRVREERTREGAFNVAIPIGEKYLHTFERDGFYDVGCDIHPGMSAQILATSSPYVAIAGDDGQFGFPEVEPGAYTLVVYTGSRRIERPLEVSGGHVNVGAIQ